MSNRFFLLAATAVAAFGLTACGTHASPAASGHLHAEIVPITPPADAAPPTGTPTYLATKVGERAGINNRDGSKAADFWVTKISVDPECDPDGHRMAGGRHTVVLDVTVKTYIDKVAGQRLSPFKVLPGRINPFSFWTTDRTGVPRRIETDMCVTTVKELPFQFVPGRTYTGQIAFATPYKSGKLQVTQSTGFFQNSTLGWEWSY
ncbi:hypothetical protein [Amycolatopsis sp. FDAARGOS 1241]|uniref:hypothetical protein n=1 Tax=Amycolatopsis sp. FDAARGOS 1241 TaxID=2778070 RepID=UPI00194ED50F|nr:hypothetical protein [Amycolatopsis sp. FDAARGOS 1241]QRP49057.1 hypothetical protein I6J71_15420 [Amycolatopsis sp. FDAARGOS 1241]